MNLLTPAFVLEDGTPVHFSTSSSLPRGVPSALHSAQSSKDRNHRVHFASLHPNKIRYLPRHHRRYLKPLSQTRKEHSNARKEYKRELKRAWRLKLYFKGWAIATKEGQEQRREEEMKEDQSLSDSDMEIDNGAAEHTGGMNVQDNSSSATIRLPSPTTSEEEEEEVNEEEEHKEEEEEEEEHEEEEHEEEEHE
jgi:hypothetical protein